MEELTSTSEVETTPTDDINAIELMTQRMAELEAKFIALQASVDALAPIEAAAEVVEETVPEEPAAPEEETASGDVVEDVETVDKLMQDN